MSDENDIILRQIKSFAQGLGYMLGKKDDDSNATEVTFEDGEVDLTPYKTALLEEIKAHDFLAAAHLLESWREARISKSQYEHLFAWLQDQRFGLPEK